MQIDGYSQPRGAGFSLPCRHSCRHLNAFIGGEDWICYFPTGPKTTQPGCGRAQPPGSISTALTYSSIWSSAFRMCSRSLPAAAASSSRAASVRGGNP